MEDQKIINLLKDKRFELAYSRCAEAELMVTKCDVTGEEKLCVVVDTSEGEYGSIAISVDYIIKQQKQNFK